MVTERAVKGLAFMVFKILFLLFCSDSLLQTQF